MENRIPRFTLKGVHDATVSSYPFATADGLGLSLTRFQRGADADRSDVVLLVHGLTLSTDMFIMPEHRNLVSYLLDEGFSDVFSLDFRMSNRFTYDTETHRYTLDDIAVNDHPAAIRELRRIVGDDVSIHVIAHCMGSVSFMMSLFGGTVGEIASMTSNSVALVTRVPMWARLKLAYGPPVFEYLVGPAFLDTRFGRSPLLTRGWMISRLVDLFHHECDVRCCHMLSFMWGSGRPAMYSHDQLNEITHERLADLCGGVGMNYYRHIHKMADAGHVVTYDPAAHPELPEDYLERAGSVTTPILFLAGEDNKVFTDSNVECHRLLNEVAPGRNDLVRLPGYGHADPFLGKNAARDVFPHILAFLDEHRQKQRTTMTGGIS